MRPIVATNLGLETSSIPRNGLFGGDAFGPADPGINDLFFIGMQTCGRRATPDVIGAARLNLGVPNLTLLPLPANPALTGVSIYATSAVFESIPVNAFGAVTANGIHGVLGTSDSTRLVGGAIPGAASTVIPAAAVASGGVAHGSNPSHTWNLALGSVA